MYEFSANYAITRLEDIGGCMFEIEEFRFITRVIGREFYLSPKTTFEYILYHDTEHFEVITSFDIYEWILETRKVYLLAYQEKSYGYDITFIDQHLSFSLINKPVSEILENGFLTTEGIMAHVKYDEGTGSRKCEINKKWYQFSFYDPYNYLDSIRRNYLGPLKKLESIDQVFKMFSRMSELNFDLHPDIRNSLKDYQIQSDYHFKVRDDLFKILEKSDSHKYIKLLSDHHFFEKALEVVEKMDRSKWEQDIKALKKLELILSTDDYFNDSTKRAIERNHTYLFPCKITKYQMLKFSVLFHHAYKSMKLKHNAPELYETDFTDFCDLFGFVNETCKYYGHVIQNSRSVENKYKTDTIDLSSLYDFFEGINKNVLDILLVEYVESIIRYPDHEKDFKERFEYFVNTYNNKYLELQSINGEMTTLEFDMHNFSDAQMMILLDDVKKQVFLGDLRYDRHSIVNYIKENID